MSGRKVWCLPAEEIKGLKEFCKGIVELPSPCDVIHEGLIKLLREKGKKLKRKELLKLKK